MRLADNLFGVPLASPIGDKKEVPRAEKFRIVDGFTNADTSKDRTVDKPKHHSYAFLAPIKKEARALEEEAHNILSKMRGDCRTAVSTTESHILKKIARPHYETCVTTKSSRRSSSSAMPSRSSDSNAPQSSKNLPIERSPQAEETASEYEPAAVHEDCYDINSCNSVPRKYHGGKITGGSVEKIFTDDADTSIQSTDDTPGASPSWRRGSATSYRRSIASSSSKALLSMVTAFTDRGIKRSQSSKEFPSGTANSSATDSKDSGINDEGNALVRSAELSRLAPGVSTEEGIQRRRDVSEFASNAGRSTDNCFTGSSDSGASACKNIPLITSSSLVSEVGMLGEDEISIRSQHPI